MKKYVVSVISTKSGSHELHLAQCSKVPKHVNELGEFETFFKALEKINKIIPQVHICPNCINQKEIKNP